MSRIDFGTDGWRAIIARDFTFENVSRVARAIARYLARSKAPRRPVVVGYDARFLADEFAAECANVLSDEGFAVLLTDRDAPTPVVAWAVKARKAMGAIMVTASHNPPSYCGLKFIPHNARPAMPDVTDKIEKGIAALAKAGDGHGRKRADITRFDPRPEYFAQLRRVVRTDVIAAERPRLAFDPLWGTTRHYLGHFLDDLGCDVHLLHERRDPLFGGRLPDPAEENLPELEALVRVERCLLGMATDNDGDRFAAIGPSGRYFPPNDLISICFYHVTTPRFGPRRRMGRKAVGRTVATTHRLDAIAARTGYDVVQTPVGFKYLGEKLDKGPCVLAGEESGGMSICAHMGEKDGILSNLLVLEAVLLHQRSPEELLGKIEASVGSFHARRYDLRLEEADGQQKKAALMRGLRRKPPQQLAGAPIVRTDLTDGVKLIASDGSWLLIRPSGTEAVVRFYAEASEPERVEAILSQARRLAG